MDAHGFDRLARTVSVRIPRRGLASVLGVSALGLGALAEGKKKKKVKKNGFGCVDVGKYCKNDGQCCSGVCDGKKKRKCKAHGASTCQPGQNSCLGVPAGCTTVTGAAGQCSATTGKASYCFTEAACFPCTKDTDCVAQFGAEAACIVCEIECGPENPGGNPKGTSCVGPGTPG